MINISQATNMLTSMGVSSNLAGRAAERTVQSLSNADPLTFLNDLRSTLADLLAEGTDTAQPSSTATSGGNTIYQSTAALYDSTKRTSSSSTSATSTPAAVKVPFSNLEEFKKWESGLGDNFAADYKPPDYVRVISQTLSGGNDTLVNRYVFFKNHPEFAADYESIRNGHLSKFPTDGSTLVKSDLSKMSIETAKFYRENPAQLLAAEGFNFDPTLAKMRMEGEIKVPVDITVSDWLMENKWTKDGISAQNNRAILAQSDYIGLDGKGGGTYRLNRYDTATGDIIAPDGLVYDHLTGEVKA